MRNKTFLLRITLAIFFSLLNSTSVFSQSLFNSSSYTFNVLTGTALEDMTGATTIIEFPNSTDPTELLDFGDGFQFVFGGVSYTNYSASPDGWMRLGSVGTTQNLGNLGSYQNNPFIAPYLEDFFMNNGGTVKVKMTGTAPNRKFIIQWIAWSNAQSFSNVTFQVWLWETTNKIDYVYGAQYTNATDYSVGFTANINGFNSLVSVTIDSSITESSVNYTLAYNQNTLSIASGTQLSFVPDTMKPHIPVDLTFNPVTAACLTFTWVDSSVNESYFEIFRSTDGVTFNSIGVIPSSTETETDSVYSYDDTSLIASTQYYYRIVATNVSTISDSLSGSVVTTAPQLSGVKMIPGDYGTIEEALLDLQCRQMAGTVILELQSNYDPALETYPIPIRNKYLATEANNLIIRPASDATDITMGSAMASTFDLKAANYVVIDGRPGGTSTTGLMTITNSSVSGCAIRFLEDASHNTIRYCNITGANTSTSSGVIDFYNFALVNGNDFNTITQCNIHDAATTPRFLIYSKGNGAIVNDSNSITENNFYDFLSSGTTSAIMIDRGNAAWDITDNHFYQTVARNVSGTFSFIYVLDSKYGKHFSISGNTFGGSNSAMSGTSLTLSGGGTADFIRVTASPEYCTSIQGNLFRNINLSLNNASFIDVDSGWVQIGDVTGNEIGRSDTAGTIVLSNIYTMGILINSPNHVILSNNKIGGVKVQGTSSEEFFAMYLERCDSTYIHSNIIGSETTSNSITSSVPCRLIGIYFYYLLNNCVIDGNKIMNFTNTNTTSNSGGGMFGIDGSDEIVSITSFNITITNNIIKKLTNAAWYGHALAGIHINSPISGNHLISGNEIAILHNTHSNDDVYVNGIYIQDGGAQTFYDIERNYIHSMWIDVAGNIQAVIAFEVQSATYNFVNNIVNLGYDADGNNVSYASWYVVLSYTGATTNFYHNSFYVGGSTTSPNQISGIMELEVSHQAEIKNNILCNARHLVSDGDHIMIYLDYGADARISDYNLYYKTQGAFDLASWQDGGTDSNSFVADPPFIDAVASSDQINMHVPDSSMIESAGLFLPQYLYDFDNQLRCDYTPADIGADAINLNIPIDVSPDTAGICPSQPTQLIASGGITYLWTPPTGLNSTTTDTVIASPATSTEYYVTVTNDMGCSYTDSVMVMVLPPDVPPQITLLNDTLFSSEGLTYQWYLNDILIPGDTNEYYVPNQTGNYKVMVSFTTGCAGPSESFYDALNDLEIVATDEAFCEDTCIDFFGSSLFIADSYYWIFSGGSPASSATQNPSGICYSDSGSFDVTLIASNIYGSDTLTLQDLINVFSYPAPVINQFGDTLVASAAFQYQWYLDGVPINGATDQSYVANQSGTYSVMVTNEGGCSASADIVVIPTALITSDFSQIEVFPNPFTTNLIIMDKGNMNSIGRITLLNETGQKVLEEVIPKTEGGLRTELNLKWLAPGVYILELRNDQVLARMPIVKQ